MLGLIFLGISFSASAQQAAIHHEESKIPSSALPELLVTNSGQPVTTPRQWEETRRPELLALFAGRMYGVAPAEEIEVSYEKIDDTHNALDGMATRKQILFTFTKGNLSRQATLLLYLPNHVKEKAAVFFGFNFKGNQTVHSDLSIRPTSDAPRGESSSRWPLETIVSAGYGVATMDCNDFYPDCPDGAAEEMPGDHGQALGAWAWGMSRALDYFGTDWQVDASRIILLGHSRLGKAALWAAAQDTRFAAVISNCTGLSSDQHALIALIAPRPVYVASASEDQWADPKEEYLAAWYAGEVYRLYGYDGMEGKELPPPDQPVLNRVGYHLRTGQHDTTAFDWQQYLLFAEKWVK